MPLLELSEIMCGYGRQEAVHSVSFKVQEGEFCGIIGPNGAGKTTIFRSITRILKPWQGTVRYKGKDIFTMPQLLETPFSFSVKEFVMMGRFPHLKRFTQPKKLDYDIVDESLKLTDTVELAGRTLNELSGGERQRAILAQALAQSPKLLLLDEPTSHLDIGHQATILDLIKKLNREQGLTVIMVQHDLNLASLYCEKLILMDRGTVFAQGTPREVLTYQNIERVYKTVVIVKEDSVSQKPHVILVPKEYL
jgi:iron complex transport system ATP-binding protein